jgi:drug/metabolite transporter (DMT)-like permease
MLDGRSAARTARTAGVTVGIMANMTWGLGYLIPVLLSAFSPVAITVGRYLSYGLVSLVIVFFAGRGMRYKASVWWTAVRFAISGNIVYYFAIVLGVSLVGAPVVAVILGTLPVTVTLYANRRHRDYPFRTLIPALLLIGFGLVVVNALEVDWSGLGEHSVGDQLLGIGCAVLSLALWTWFSVANSTFLKANPQISSAEWSTVIGIVTLVLSMALVPVMLAGGGVLAPSTSETAVPRSSWWWLVVGAVILGVLVSWFATLLWNRASVLLPMSLAGQLIVFETLSGLGYVFAVTGRVPPLLEFAGIAMVVGGVLLGLRRAGTADQATRDVLISKHERGTTVSAVKAPSSPGEPCAAHASYCEHCAARAS